jgi:uncharacterized membrane protein
MTLPLSILDDIALPCFLRSVGGSREIYGLARRAPERDRCIVDFIRPSRRRNVCTDLAGAAPVHDDGPGKLRALTERAGRIASSAMDPFNNGLPACYFGLAAITWFLNAWLFIFAVAAWVVLLYHREFHSDALQALRKDRL